MYIYACENQDLIQLYMRDDVSRNRRRRRRLRRRRCFNWRKA